MKIITVENIVLQFDLEDDVTPSKEVVELQVDLINSILSEHLSWSQPQLLVKDVKTTVIDCNHKEQ